MTFGTNTEIEAEIRDIEGKWDALITAKQFEAGEQLYGARFHSLLAEQARRKTESAPAVVRLRFLAGEHGRKLDAACAEALGWRVSKDPWWNWHPGPVFDPPGDEWSIRKDGRNDRPCNEALPVFTEELFERELRALKQADKGAQHG